MENQGFAASRFLVLLDLKRTSCYQIAERRTLLEWRACLYWNKKYWLLLDWKCRPLLDWKWKTLPEFWRVLPKYWNVISEKSRMNLKNGDMGFSQKGAIIGGSWGCFDQIFESGFYATEMALLDWACTLLKFRQDEDGIRLFTDSFPDVLSIHITPDHSKSLRISMS